MDQEKTGKFIALRRKAKKMTQEKLALELGVSSRLVSKWETGKRFPNISYFSSLCDILDVDVSELLAGEKIKDDKKRDKAIVEYLIYTEKKMAVKYFVACLVALILAIILVAWVLISSFIGTMYLF